MHSHSNERTFRPDNVARLESPDRLNWLSPHEVIDKVTANDPKEEASIAAIRSHLAAIAKQLSGGNFDAPMMVHGTTPPGVETMKASNTIRYEYDAVPSGGRVRLASDDRQSIGAFHDFLRFQIEEHRTGDSTAVK